MLTVSQQNFRDGLHLSLDQANLYEKETCNQADNLMSHKLIAQILIASNFKDFFCCKKDFESLVEHFMKKTVQTTAIIYGFENEENANMSYADMHMACSPDC